MLDPLDVVPLIELIIGFFSISTHTLAAQQPHLPLVKVGELEWSDTPDKVHIAIA